MLECCGTGRLNMNQKDRSGSLEGSSKAETKAKGYNVPDWNYHYHGSRNSAEDPKITSSRTDKYLSSNVRIHPQADVQGRSYSHISGDSGQRKKSLSSASTNHMYNHVSEKISKAKSCDSTPHNGKRRKCHEREEMEGEWTAHESSSSGRIYYYNKRLDKSQWETPKGLVKRARTDSTQLSSSTHHDTRRGEGDRIRLSGHGCSGNHDPGHTHRGKTDVHAYVREGGVDRGSSSGRRGGSGHDNDRKRQRDKKSLSHSHSSSPVSSSKRGSSSTSSGGHGLKNTGSNLSRGVVGGNGSRGRSDKNHQTALGLQHGYHSCHASPSAGSTPKGSAGTPGIQLISPTTPSGVLGCIPPSLSHTLTTTQQLIDQNSLLIEQRQKLLLAGETTPTMQMTTPTSTPMVSTPPTHHLTRPLAKKRLLLTPYQTHSPCDHAHSMGMTTPTNTGVYTGGGVVYSGQVDGVLTSPQGTSSLHPLQKALLLQNQQQQQQLQEQLQQQQLQEQLQQQQLQEQLQQQLQEQLQQQQLQEQLQQQQLQEQLQQQQLQEQLQQQQLQEQLQQQQLQEQQLQHQQLQQQKQPKPSTSYYCGVLNHTHPMTPTALPPHMTSMPSSHPSSPGLRSPSLASQGAPVATPAHLVNVQPLTPVVQQPRLYMAPANMDSAVAMPSYQLVNSTLLRRPVSRLGYQVVSLSDATPFPNGCGLVDQSVPTQVNSDLMNSELAEMWIQHHEMASKQVEQCRIETWRRRVVEAMYLSGRLAERRLSLEGIQVRTFSRGQRLACVQGLILELDKR